MSADPARSALDARVLAWAREPSAASDDARFGALALDLFAFQFAHCAPYRRFCEGRGATPASVRDWTRIPPVPAGAFKELALCCFPPEREEKVFRTSGTATHVRGALHLDTLAVYEGSLLPSFRRHLLPDLAAGARARILVLAPPPEELPDSSLSHMFGVAVRELGDPASGCLVKGGELDAAAALAALRDLERGGAGGRPLLVCGTAFAFVHLLDALSDRGASLRLPGSARVMETGGFKGRARERSQAELYAEIEAGLGVPAARIVNQYGMTELGSQFHDTVVSEPAAPRRKLGPPWARVRIVDPATGAARRPGEIGAVQIFDLANTGSVLAIQTADLGREVAGGFEVIGREAGAEARGCSIAADELLGGDAG